MKGLKTYLTNSYVLYGIIIFLILLNIGGTIFWYYKLDTCQKNSQKNCEKTDEISLVTSEEEIKDVKKMLKVDIKGYVKKPGVYEVEEGAIVNDVINLAGGVKSGGSTENINLSKKVVDEAMIFISSKTALKKETNCQNNEINNSSSLNSNVSANSFAVEEPMNTVTDNNLGQESTTSNNSPSDKKVSINSATKEELMTLSGIGEKTAEKIIAYRETQKFSSIEDLKNVSGIGDSIFEKIKDFITI